MEISFGDTSFKGLRSQSGQGVIEYLLVLIVTVIILLGGVWQLNDAFKLWANNYFGNYLACLLETGELPTIGGSPGDSAICEQLFEPFSFAKGRPAVPQKGDGSDSEGSKASSQGTPDRNTGAGQYMGGSGSGRSGRWASGSSGVSNGGAKTGNKDKSEDNGSNTGSTGISSTGGGYRGGSRAGAPQRITILDNKSTLDEGKEKNKRTKVTSSTPSGRESRTNVRIPIARKPAKAAIPDNDNQLNFSDFLRYLLIAGIIIALVLFIGGQMLQMSKSMEQ